MAINLISMTKLLNKGVKIDFSSNSCNLSYNGKFLSSGKFEYGLILFQSSQKFEKGEEYALSTISENKWHTRMGHIGNTALKGLYKATLGPKEPLENSENSEKCEICLKAKLTAKISRQEPEKA